MYTLPQSSIYLFGTTEHEAKSCHDYLFIWYTLSKWLHTLKPASIMHLKHTYSSSCNDFLILQYEIKKIENPTCVLPKIRVQMCPSLTFWVQLANFVILKIWYHLKELCLKIKVSNKEYKYSYHLCQNYYFEIIPEAPQHCTCQISGWYMFINTFVISFQIFLLTLSEILGPIEEMKSFRKMTSK